MSEDNYSVVTELELLSKMSDTENNFIERKTEKDHRGWLQTAVAFANSCPVGQPGILYIGVDDNGVVRKQSDGYKFEDLQKNISARIANAWPPIYFVTHILKKDGLEFVAVVIFGSPLRPHFSGPAYVRIGPETRNASEEKYDEFVAQRSSKVRALQKMIGEQVHWVSVNYQPGGADGTLIECNQFYVTIQAITYQKCLPVD